jgi:predicted esterase
MLSVSALQRLLKELRAPAAVASSECVTTLAAAAVDYWQRASEPIITVQGQFASNHTAAVIFSHGLGDTGHGWSEAFEAFSVKMPYCKFLFPTARAVPVTMAMGERIPAWYDIKRMDDRIGDAAEGAELSATFLQSLVHQTAAEVGGTHRVMLAGFSQGAGMSVIAGHTCDEQLAGIVAMSGYLTAQPLVKALWQPANHSTNVFMAHGTADMMVPFETAQESCRLLRALKKPAGAEADAAAAARDGMNGVVFRKYDGLEHCSSEQEMLDVYQFVRMSLPPTDK